MADARRAIAIVARLRVLAVLVLAPAVLVAPGRAAPGAVFDLGKALANAPDGALVEVPAGTYAGPLVIERPVRLVARGTVIIDGGGEGDVVRIDAPDVTVRGFVIRNTGKSLDRENAGITGLAPRLVVEGNVFEDVLFGIYLKGAEDSVIRGNTIGGKDLAVQRRGDGIRIWQSHRTLIEGNVVHDSRDAVMWFSDDVVLRGNRITNGRYGLHFMYSNRNLIEGNHLTDNSVGAFLMYSKDLTLRANVFARNRGPSGYGLGLKDMDGTRAEGNAFVGNRVGMHLDTSPSSVRGYDEYARNLFAFNDIGIAFLPSVKNNGFVDNTFHENIEQVAVLGAGNFEGNDFTREGRGNFWSDYRGYDLDGDGLGDLPYRAESLFENLMDREPKLRLFLYGPAQQAVEMAARAFPVVKPRPKLTDTAPLMAPPPTAVTAGPAPPAAPLALLAATLLLGAGATLAVGAWPVGGARSTSRVPERAPS